MTKQGAPTDAGPPTWFVRFDKFSLGNCANDRTQTHYFATTSRGSFEKRGICMRQLRRV